MGANSICLIPNDTDPEDIIQAIAYLCGATRIREGIGDNSWFAGLSHREVNTDARNSIRDYKVSIAPTHSMSFYTIHIAPTTCDREWHQGNLFIFSSDFPGFIMLHAGVSEFWKRIDRELVNMFGGKVDDNDCDLVDWDYTKRKPRKNNHPTDGEPWQKFQKDLFNLPKLFDFIEAK